MKRILTSLLLFSVILFLTACSQNSANQAAAGSNIVASGIAGTGDMANSHVKSITAINKVFADGIKTVAVVLEYDKSISTAKLLATAFAVKGKTITKVYANTEASTAEQGVDGKFVVAELSTDYQIPVGAATTSSHPAGNPPANGGNGPAVGAPETGTSQSASAGPSITPEDKMKHPGLLLSTTNGGNGISVSITQTGSISTVDGETYKSGNTALNNQKDINLIVDDFLKPDFSEPNNQQHYKFNLYIPKDYDKSKSYPLVLFIQDEDSLSSTHAGSLTQSLGGVIWADNTEQAKHECFVLVPSFRDTIVGNNYSTTPDLDMTADLIKYLETQYGIDKNRIYSTGQSMGSEACIALNLKYPDMFAASLLVAGQWDPVQIASLSKANLWFVASEGDDQTYAGVNDCIASLQKAGAKVSMATWSGQSSASEYASYVSKILAEGGNIKYSLLKKGTVVPNGITDNDDNNHAYTWRVAYTIEGLRDWLFTQVKTPKS